MDASRPLLVDTDPALLTFGFDVDDDLALLLLLASPEVEVVGVTTTFGNTFSSWAYRDAKSLVAFAGRKDVPVRRGASHFARDSRETPASRFLADAAQRRPGELTLLTLGPLTNVAAAARLDPEFPSNLKEIVVMGGRTTAGACEFNFRADPASADTVVAFETPKTEIAFDLAFSVAITPDDVEKMAPPGSILAPFARKLRRFARFQDRYRARRGRAPGEATGGFHPWDVVAAAYLVDPSLYGDVREVAPRVSARGVTRFDEASGRPRVRMPFSLDVARFRELMLGRLAGTKPG